VDVTEPPDVAVDAVMDVTVVVALSVGAVGAANVVKLSSLPYEVPTLLVANALT
jgi:hypothetical protein